MAEQPGLGFAGLLRQLRTAARLTQEELADAASLSPRSVSDLERGIHRTAHGDTARLLADALGLAEPARALFVAAARGRTSAAEVLAAAREAAPPAAAATRTLPRETVTFAGRGRDLIAPGLPVPLTSFIGRDAEMGQVRAVLADSRLATLTGPGGVGKTRLALQVAAGVVAEFPAGVAADLLDGSGDGVWLVELAAVTDENAVAAAIAEALRIPAQPGRPVLEVVADALAPQDMLIVLDNCEHLISGCAKTVETILRRGPKVRVLATSREPLGVAGETIYRVPSLSLPAADADPESAAGSSDAVALLATRARGHGVDLSLDEQGGSLLVSLCRQLDGMPLAIELAAARLRSMSLTDLAARLDQRFRLLTGGSRTALARQQTLLATVSWSFSLLTAAEQVLLGRLSVFAGAFDLPAAEAVCGFDAMDAVEVAGLLGSLVDKSLVVTEPAAAGLRYRLLETIRLFAAERLAEAGQEAAAAHKAHCAHYLAVAEGAASHLVGREQGSWFDRLEADHANLRRAAEHAAGEPDGTSRVLRFGIALWRYWFARSRSEEAAGLLVPVLRRPDAAAHPALLAEALFAAAALTANSDLSTSLRLAEQADEVACAVGDDRLLVLSRAMLSWAYFNSGELERARQPGREAVERARKLGDDVLLGFSLVMYAAALGAAESEPLCAEAIACADRTGDLSVSVAAHAGAGLTALEIGEIRSARADMEAAVRAAQAVGDPHLAISVNFGLVLRAEQDLEGARAEFRDVLRIGRRIGDKGAVAYAILGLACLAADISDWYGAAMLHGTAQALLDQTGLPWERLEAQYRQESLSQIAAAVGDEQLGQACAQGMALSFDQAIDLALKRGPAV